MSKNETDRQADEAPERERERRRWRRKMTNKERRCKDSHEHREEETIEQSDNEDGEI